MHIFGDNQKIEHWIDIFIVWYNTTTSYGDIPIEFPIELYLHS